MAQQVSRRTVGLDVSGLPASNDQKDVSQFIVEHFAHFNIYAVQSIGTVNKVTFALEASKQQVITHQSINISGGQCGVRGGWSPRACIVGREAIPRHFSIRDFQVKISYADQQEVCALWAAPGHIA